MDIYGVISRQLQVREERFLLCFILEDPCSLVQALKKAPLEIQSLGPQLRR